MIHVDPESALREAVASCARDPLKFTIMAYPWGQPGTPLADIKQPEPWQIEDLRDMRDHLQRAPFETYRSAIRAAHGTGKSAEASWIGQWAMSTMPDTRVLMTAGTEPQLRTKTIPEFTRWFNLCLTRRWFKLHTMSMHAAQQERSKTWRLDFLPWNENAPEAFAGLHNRGRRVLIIFDEAAQIPQPIWDVAEGALTDAETERMFLVRSNATRNSGAFFECFNRHRNRWRPRKIDGREVSFTDKAEIAGWIEAYGEDSDFVRVRIKGEFPRAGSMQFIPNDRVSEAMTRKVSASIYDPVVIGVDVAREGDDETVIAIRHGRDARSIPWEHLRVPDTMAVAGRVSQIAQRLKPDAIFVDIGGVGAGVFDRLRQLGVGRGRLLAGVNFGQQALGLRFDDERTSCANRAAEMWAGMRAWLPLGAIPNDPQLESDLTGREYGFDASNRIMLERKRDMKKRGLASPDRADALALTFAAPVLTMADRGARPKTYSAAQTILG